MRVLQRVVQRGRRILPRGWAPVLRLAAALSPALRRYPAQLASGDCLVLDLRQSMCLGYFFFGGLPHEPGVERILRGVLSDGAGFVDIGANIGYYTRLGSRLVGATGKVHAFEPQPSALELLRANTRDRANVTVHPVALGSEEGEANFFIKPSGDTSSLDPDGATKAIRVQVTTLDRALRETRRIDLIKIDVEGFELDVLRGAREVIRAHQPVVCFECIETYVQRRGIRFEDFGAYFSELGYELRWVGRSTDGVMDQAPSSDVVAFPRSRADLLAELVP